MGQAKKALARLPAAQRRAARYKSNIPTSSAPSDSFLPSDGPAMESTSKKRRAPPGNSPAKPKSIRTSRSRHATLAGAQDEHQLSVIPDNEEPEGQSEVGFAPHIPSTWHLL